MLVVQMTMPSAFGSVVGPEQCWPSWFDESNPDFCPYGTLLPSGVTWREDRSIVQRFICTFYGYASYVAAAGCIACFMIKRGTRELYFLCFLGAGAIFNQWTLKQITEEGRPEGTCNLDCGMPSGHSYNALLMYTIVILDLAYRLNPLICDATDCKLFIWHFIPLANTETIDNNKFVGLVTFWSVIFLPIPFTRVWNDDHTMSQIFWGGLIGVIEGFLYFFFMRFMGSRFGTKWRFPTDRFWYLLSNDIELPWWHGKRFDVRMLDNVELQSSKVAASVREANSDDSAA